MVGVFSNRWTTGLAMIAAGLFCHMQVQTATGQGIPGGGLPGDDIVSAQIPFCFETDAEVEDPPPTEPAKGVQAENEAKAEAHGKLDALWFHYFSLGLDVEIVIEEDDGGHSFHHGAGPFGVDFWEGHWTLKGYLIITGPRWLVEGLVIALE